MIKAKSLMLAIAITVSLSATTKASEAPVLMPAGTPENVIRTYNTGVDLAGSGSLQQAAEKFQEVMRELPRYVPAHLAYASCLEEQGKMEDAIRELEDTERFAPDDGSVLRALGRAYQLNGQRDKAIKQLDRFIWLYPDDKDAAYYKNAIESMRKENEHTSVFADSRGRDDYMEECLGQTVRRWRVAQMPVPVYIHSGEGIRGMRPEYVWIMRQCFDEWAKAANDRVSFKFVDRPETALITCRWAETASELESPIEAGETLARGVPMRLREAKITILTKSPSGGPVQNIKGTCLHEVGHALGLAGHSSDTRDIMFMFSKKNDLAGSTLTERDKRTILRLYSLSTKEMEGYARHSSLDNYDVGTETEQSAELCNQAGALKFGAGRYLEAAADFEKALKMKPDFAMYLQNTGKAYLKAGMQELKDEQLIKAQSHLERAANLLKKGSNPELVFAAYSSLAELARKAKSPADAKMYEAEAARARKPGLQAAPTPRK